MSSLVNALFAAILADRTQVTVELLVRLSSVCPSVHLSSVTNASWLKGAR